jgi:hypothetical protein
MEKDEGAYFKACKIEKYVGSIENCKANWKANGKVCVSGDAQNVYCCKNVPNLHRRNNSPKARCRNK